LTHVIEKLTLWSRVTYYFVSW